MRLCYTDFTRSFNLAAVLAAAFALAACNLGGAPHAVSLDASLTCRPAQECVVALRTDDCCGGPIPTTQANVDAEPCLSQVPVDWERVPARCTQVREEQCALVDCIPRGPISRLAQCDGSGECQLADECSTGAECVVAMDWRSCCGCPQILPRLLLDTQPCLVEDGSGESPGPGCDLPSCSPDACATMGVCWEPTASCNATTRLCEPAPARPRRRATAR